MIDNYSILKIRDADKCENDIDDADDSIQLVLHTGVMDRLFLDDESGKSRSNWLLSILIISCIIIIVYLVTCGCEEIIRGISPYWDFLYQLSIAYVVSFMFYFITVIIPDRRKKQRLKIVIEIRIMEIVDDMLCVLREIIFNAEGNQQL